LRHAHWSSGPETPPSATGTSRTTFFTRFFLLLLHQTPSVKHGLILQANY
jgi:hypothetical protein